MLAGGSHSPSNYNLPSARGAYDRHDDSRPDDCRQAGGTRRRSAPRAVYTVKVSVSDQFFFFFLVFCFTFKRSQIHLFHIKRKPKKKKLLISTNGIPYYSGSAVRSQNESFPDDGSFNECEASDRNKGKKRIKQTKNKRTNKHTDKKNKKQKTSKAKVIMQRRECTPGPKLGGGSASRRHGVRQTLFICCATHANKRGDGGVGGADSSRERHSANAFHNNKPRTLRRGGGNGECHRESHRTPPPAPHHHHQPPPTTTTP